MVQTSAPISPACSTYWGIEYHGGRHRVPLGYPPVFYRASSEYAETFGEIPADIGAVT